MARMQSKVSSGEAGKEGAAAQAAGDAPMKTPIGGDMTQQFVQVDMSAVKGGPTAGSQHAGAPDGGAGGGAIPGSAGTPNQGHAPSDISRIGAHMPGASVLSGNHNPVRRAGRQSPSNPTEMT